MFCHITSHIDGEKYPDLHREKGGNGFPTLIFLDADGKVQARQQKRSVEGFASTLASLNELDKRASQANAKEPKVANGLFLSRLHLGVCPTESQLSVTSVAAG